MRSILRIMLMVVFSWGTLNAQFEPASHREPLEIAACTWEWRRTDAGWEQLRVTDGNVPARSVPWNLPHPVLFAAFQLLLSLGGLVVFASERDLARPLESLNAARVQLRASFRKALAGK